VFQKYEHLLDTAATGPIWLKKKEIAQTVQNALHYHDEQSYDLYAFTIMYNHVHLVFRHLTYANKNEKLGNKYPVTDILHSIKSYTALECNKILDRKGRFWQSESYDRVIRNKDELEKTIWYTLNNPVKAGFVDQWQEWAYSYCTPKFMDTFK
jgi:REP element-mobilizing transposase RayT